MRRKLVKVRLSELHEQQLECPPWEIPILESMHQGVEVLGETVCDTRVLPPEDEWARLEKRFGEVPDSGGRSRVAAVYGEGFMGLEALRAQMRSALAEQEELDRARAEQDARRVEEAAAATADATEGSGKGSRRGAR